MRSWYKARDGLVGIRWYRSARGLQKKNRPSSGYSASVCGLEVTKGIRVEQHTGVWPDLSLQI